MEKDISQAALAKLIQEIVTLSTESLNHVQPPANQEGDNLPKNLPKEKEILLISKMLAINHISQQVVLSIDPAYKLHSALPDKTPHVEQALGLDLPGLLNPGSKGSLVSKAVLVNPKTEDVAVSTDEVVILENKFFGFEYLRIGLEMGEVINSKLVNKKYPVVLAGTDSENYLAYSYGKSAVVVRNGQITETLKGSYSKIEKSFQI